MNAVDQIRQAFGLKTDVAVARMCRVAKQTVHDWRRLNKVPPKHVLALQDRAFDEGHEFRLRSSEVRDAAA